MLVEGTPSGEQCSNVGYFAVKEGTAIFREQDGDQLPASSGDLRAGQLVEATYAGPIAASCPPQGVAGKIVILDDGEPAVLPDTGGAPLPVLGVLLIAGGLLARRVAGH